MIANARNAAPPSLLASMSCCARSIEFLLVARRRDGHRCERGASCACGRRARTSAARAATGRRAAPTGARTGTPRAGAASRSRKLRIANCLSCSGSHCGACTERRRRGRSGRTARPRTAGCARRSCLVPPPTTKVCVALEVGEVVERRRRTARAAARPAPRSRSARRARARRRARAGGWRARSRRPGVPFSTMSCTVGDLRLPADRSRPRRPSTPGERPCGGSIPLLPDVHHSVREQHHEADERRGRRRGSRGGRRGWSRAAGTSSRRTGRSPRARRARRGSSGSTGSGGPGPRPR